MPRIKVVLSYDPTFFCATTLLYYLNCLINNMLRMWHDPWNKQQQGGLDVHLFFGGEYMLRTVTMVLASAAVVSVLSPSSGSAQEMDLLANQLEQKLQIIIRSADSDVDHACIEAQDLQLQLRGMSAQEAEVFMDQNRVLVQERLQRAISLFSEVSENVGTQVEEVKVHIQGRLHERKMELVKLQDRIRAHEAASGEIRAGAGTESSTGR